MCPIIQTLYLAFSIYEYKYLFIGAFAQDVYDNFIQH